MHSRRTVIGTGLAAAVGLGVAPRAAAVSTSAYDRRVLVDEPVGYWGMAHPADRSEVDLTGNGHTGHYTGVTSTLRLPNRDGAAIFDGVNDYFEVADHASFSISTTGQFSFEVWMQPHTLQFANDERSGYVHFIGKGLTSGTSGDREWAGRMYSKVNDEDRPNRISGYAWNLTGGFGAGAAVQDPVTVGEWIHYVTTFNMAEGPYGKVRVHKNGVLRSTQDLVYRPGTDDEVIVVPGNGGAPVRVGTREGDSWFTGAIAKVALYDKALSSSAVSAHYAKMYA